MTACPPAALDVDDSPGLVVPSPDDPDRVVLTIDGRLLANEVAPAPPRRPDATFDASQYARRMAVRTSVEVEDGVAVVRQQRPPATSRAWSGCASGPSV